MYCNKCGERNPDGSRFCKSCGVKIGVEIEKSEVTSITFEQDDVITNKVDKEIPEEIKTPSKGFTGWLALLGFGLILNIFISIYGFLGYLPQLGQSYVIPGFTEVLHVEFILHIVLVFLLSYVTFLFFKKSNKFPKYFVFYLIFLTLYTIFDYFLMDSLSTTDVEMQAILDASLEDMSTEFAKTIMYSIIWGSYVIKSKQVAHVFVN